MIRSTWARAGFALLLCVSFAPAARAGAPICVQDLPVWLERSLRVPVGCALPGCCPRCTSEGPLDLRVRIEGELVAGAEVRVEGPDGVYGRTHRAERGETWIRGVGSGGEASHATLRFLADPASERLLEGAGGRSLDVAVRVEQWLGDAMVDEWWKRWTFVPCDLPGPCDKIRLEENRGGDSSVVLFDAAGSSGCLDDRVHRITLERGVGNLRSDPACRSEIGVFSGGDAVAWSENVSAWTDECGDVAHVEPGPLLSAPVTVFLAVPDLVALAEWGETVADVAKQDFARANELYDDNKAGVFFDPQWTSLDVAEGLELLLLLPEAIESALLEGSVIDAPCNIPSQLEEKGLYVPGRLNVYYLPVPGTGMTCDDDRNIIFVALNEKPETLAHEFGHALSLVGSWGHSNDIPGLGPNNLMWVQEWEVRDHIALGQAFRMNLDETSVLNTNGVRTGAERRCPAEPTAVPDPTSCPPLKIDWARP